MQIKILAFGIAREIVGGRQVDFAIGDGATVQELKKALNRQYPALDRLASLMVAVNGAYAEDEAVIRPEDEVVLIPPVSGG